jgi:hypothetical protein
LLYRQLEGSEARGTILGERSEQSTDHLLDAAVAKVSAETLDVYAWQGTRNV